MSLASQTQSAFVTLAGAVKASKVLLNNNAADLSALDTTVKTNLVAALNEVYALVSGGSGVTINDTTPSLTEVYSSQKTVDAIAAAINALTTGAPAALDTLNELAAALGDDADFAGTVTTALGSRVRTDTGTQGLTSPQKQNARDNIDVYSKTEIGDPATDFVAVVTAALA